MGPHITKKGNRELKQRELSDPKTKEKTDMRRREERVGVVAREKRVEAKSRSKLKKSWSET